MAPVMYIGNHQKLYQTTYTLLFIWSCMQYNHAIYTFIMCSAERLSISY